MSAMLLSVRPMHAVASGARGAGFKLLQQHPSPLVFFHIAPHPRLLAVTLVPTPIIYGGMKRPRARGRGSYLTLGAAWCPGRAWDKACERHLPIETPPLIFEATERWSHPCESRNLKAAQADKAELDTVDHGKSSQGWVLLTQRRRDVRAYNIRKVWDR